VAGRVRKAVRPLCTGQISTLFEQRAQVEGPVRFATFVRALVAGLRPRHISTGLEEHAEVERRARMAQCIGFVIRKFGAGQIAALLQQQPEAEPLDRGTGAVDQFYAPRHPPLTIRPPPFEPPQR
jgi:hypothetical protein